MAKMIDVEELWLAVRDDPNITGKQFVAIKEHILGAKAVDAVEVVRCEKCIHWKDDVAGCTGFVHRCAIANYMVGETGYCVYAERKVEDG